MKVYLHIPFCHSKCAYCDFYSLARPDFVDRYLDAVAAEWEARRPAEPADTLYIGGGTPSLLPPAAIARLVGLIAPGPLRELTVEANPEDVTPAWVEAMRAVRPDVRVSIGIQSLVDTELRAISRRHTAAAALAALECLRSGGVTNISADLIYGLPGQTLESFTFSLRRLLEFRPPHLSAYLLSIEEGTLLGRRLAAGQISEASDTLAGEMYDTLCRLTREAGYRHYEISNFALPGAEAIHNSSYWDLSPYIGLGPGAHSYVDGRRGANRPDLRAYIASHGIGIYEEEDESRDSQFNDLLLTALRTARGLSLADVSRLFGPDILTALLAAAAPSLASGTLILTDSATTPPHADPSATPSPAASAATHPLSPPATLTAASTPAHDVSHPLPSPPDTLSAATAKVGTRHGASTPAHNVSHPRSPLPDTLRLVIPEHHWLTSNAILLPLIRV